ncbi:unnamed protein product [Parnassius apollo]|uniref:(apollo) hypothetical protein n=1 Tax=Parnassius apollo TaxID=110799 RepID=A0A8S3WZX1_PARAO|nr:unnamed protein product [Parnassius apollo]
MLVNQDKRNQVDKVTELSIDAFEVTTNNKCTSSAANKPTMTIFSYTQKNYDQHKLLHRVLQHQNQYGIIFNIEKCEIGKTAINYQGYEVSEDGIKTQDRSKAIALYLKLKTVIELRRLLGVINFYQDYLLCQTTRQIELNMHLHNKKRNNKTLIKWTLQTEDAFKMPSKHLVSTAH